MSRSSAGKRSPARRLNWKLTAAAFSTSQPNDVQAEAEMGRRAHQPDPAQRKQVETLAAHAPPLQQLRGVGSTLCDDGTHLHRLKRSRRFIRGDGYIFVIAPNGFKSIPLLFDLVSRSKAKPPQDRNGRAPALDGMLKK